MKRYFEVEDFYKIADIFFGEATYDTPYNSPIRAATASIRQQMIDNIEHVAYYSLDCLPECELFIVDALIERPSEIGNFSFRYEIPFSEVKALSTKLQAIVDELNEQLKQLYYKGE